MAFDTSVTTSAIPAKRAADYVFYELTRSIGPECRTVVDAQVILRDNKVYPRKRCPEHGRFEAFVYGDAQAYVAAAKFNKPGTIPLKFATAVERGCPHDQSLPIEADDDLAVDFHDGSRQVTYGLKLLESLLIDCDVAFGKGHVVLGKKLFHLRAEQSAGLRKNHDRSRHLTSP